MRKQITLAAGLVFTGFIAGLASDKLIESAQAGEPDWQKISQQPEFRRAVAEVVASCIVDNSIIYCN